MRGALDLVEVLVAEVGGIERRRDQLGVAGDHGQQVVEVVGDAAGQSADCLHLHCLRQLLLRRLQLALRLDHLGHVARVGDGEHLPVGRVVAFGHRFEVAPRAVLVTEAIAHRPDHHVGREQLRELLMRAGDVVGVHHVEIVAADQLVRVVAELPAHRLALVDGDSVRTKE